MNADRLKAIIEAAGFTPRAYSGRYMYGKECVAFSSEEAGALVRLGGCCKTARERSAVAGGARSEALGKGRVYYWPEAGWARPS